MKKSLHARFAIAALAAALVAAVAAALVAPAFTADNTADNTESIASQDALQAAQRVSKSLRLPGKTAAASTSKASASDSSTSQGQGYTLLTEPTSGRTQILSLLNGAKVSINLTIYEIEDPQIISAMTAAVQRGVNVRVLYNYNSFQHFGHDPNAPFVTQLNGAGVQTKPAGQRFFITHQKTFSIDDRAAVIMTFNLTPNYFTGTRDFGIVTSNPAQVAEIVKVFNADWAYQPVSVSNGALVWSPDNSRTKTIDLINSATRTLDVYNEETSDQASMQALIEAAKRGVTVRFITAVLTSHANPGQDANAAERATLSAAGVQAKGMAKPYIHAKAIIADGSRAFLGSENFSSASLGRNRELGIILDDSGIVSSMESTFQSDWGQ